MQTGSGQGWSSRNLSQQPGAGRAGRDRFTLGKAGGPTKSLQREAEAVPGPEERKPLVTGGEVGALGQPWDGRQVKSPWSDRQAGRWPRQHTHGSAVRALTGLT